jgi:HlyD family secretion protein
VFSIAITDPKWVRAYVSEPDLPRVHADMAANVTVDGEQNHGFTGHVGYISPVAEFTPRSVQTQELRTSLVYEVRILIDDPDDILKLGQPATVHLADGDTADAPAS